MPLNLRACLFMLFVSFVPAVLLAQNWHEKKTFRWITLWMLVSSAAFLSPVIGLYFAALAGICFLGLGRGRTNAVACFLLLLPAVHIGYGFDIPGMIPGIRRWFFLNHPRGLILIILLPLFLRILIAPSWKGRLPLSIPTDGYMFGYLFLLFCFCFRAPSLTDGLRQLLLSWIDIFLPYYVISRSIQKAEDYHVFFSAIFFSGVFLSFLGLFEEAKKWNVYESSGTLALLYAPMFRSGFLRVSATFFQPIAFGYFLVIAIAATFFLSKRLFKNIPFFLVTTTVLSLTLILTFSRGPWMGGIVFLLTWLVLLKLSKKIKFLIFALGAMVLALPLLTGTPLGQKVAQALPFVGSQEQETVGYRQDLFRVGLETVKKNPWFGSNDFLNYMEEEDQWKLKKAAGGIVDVVNAYLGIALRYGVVGLLLFAGIFLSLLWRLFWAFQGNLPDGAMENAGRTLFCLIAAILVMLATVSSISYIPYYYWSLAGLAAGYLRLKRIGDVS